MSTNGVNGNSLIQPLSITIDYQAMPQDLKAIADKEIEDAMRIIDSDALSQKEKAKEKCNISVEKCNELIEQAQAELDAAIAMNELYAYDSKGFLGLEGRYDNSTTIEQFKSDYYGTDTDGDGSVDSVAYKNLSYDTVAAQEIERLEEIFKMPIEQMTTDVLQEIESIMDKMAKEAKKSLPKIVKQEKTEFNDVSNAQNRLIESAKQTLAKEEQEILDWSQTQKNNVEIEMQNDFVQNGIWNPDYIEDAKNNGVDFTYTDIDGNNVTKSTLESPNDATENSIKKSKNIYIEPNLLN